MSTYKFSYFDVPARGEVARMLFALADQPYTDVRVNKAQDWGDMKNKTLFGCVPLLEVDGVTLCQSHAINKFLAKRFGYTGKTDVEEAQVDMVAACVEDVIQCLQPLNKLAKDAPRIERDLLRSRLQPGVMPMLDKLEAMIISNGGGDGYFVGNSLTWADLAFIVRIGEFPTRPHVAISIDWSRIPKLEALKQRVEAEPRIAKWIAERPS